MQTTVVTRAALAALALGAAPGAFALEALKLYDNFNTGTTVNQALWPGDFDSAREIVGKQLRLMYRGYGSTTSDLSDTETSFSNHIADPLAVTEISAQITVTNAQADACATNTATLGSARARIYGEFFNVGPKVAGSSLNDVTAQVRVVRNSNSTDPVGTYVVEARVFQCNDAACNGTTTLGALAMGTTTSGTPVKVQLQWDKPNKRFLFARDGGAAVPVAYTVSDNDAPSTPAALVGLRVNVPNCTDTARPSSMVDAKFDNVYVNKSAVP